MLEQIVQEFSASRMFPHADNLLSFSVQEAPKEGLVLEFGVASGHTIRILAHSTFPRQVYGFDWFHGIPEHWNRYNPQGIYSTNGQPPTDLPDNVTIVNGLFQDTLIPFLETHPEPVAFVHVDCDLYSSTKFILDTLESRFVTGTILNFNEFWNYEGQEDHEAKAFTEFIQKDLFSYEFLGRTPIDYTQTAVRLTRK